MSTVTAGVTVTLRPVNWYLCTTACDCFYRAANAAGLMLLM